MDKMLKNPTYDLQTLKDTFLLHHERSKELNKKLIKEFQENNPGEPIPAPFNDEFSLPLALAALCEEILRLRDLLAQVSKRRF